MFRNRTFKVLSNLILLAVLCTGQVAAAPLIEKSPNILMREVERKIIATPSLIWNTFLGGNETDVGHSIAVDGDGNVYSTGVSSAAWGSPVRTYTSSEDAFVAKLSLSGELIWNTFLGGDGSDTGYGIAVDGDGNVYVTGWSSATWGSPVRAYTNADAFVAKLSPSGELIWNTFLGGSEGYSGNDDGKGIAVDGDGNIYVTGYSSGSWGIPVNPKVGWYDAYVAKLNTSGTLVWNTFMGGSGLIDTYSSGITVDGGGNIYVSGWSSGTWGVPVDPYSGGNNDDVFAAKLNNNGALVWNTFMGSSVIDDRGYGIAVDGSGGVYVTGAMSAYDIHTSVAFASKLDSNGVRQWNTFVGSGDYGEAIAVDGIGNVYVVGFSTKTWGTPVNPFAGYYDAFVAMLDISGTLLWNTFMGGPFLDTGSGIAINGSENIYITGQSYTTWGTPVNPYAGAIDSFVAKVGDISLTPFLDLPIEYIIFAQSANGNYGGNNPGRVNSWFDHHFPDYGKDYEVTTWQGMSISYPPGPSNDPDKYCILGISCYAGHNGIDFRNTQSNELIYAAANGTIFGVVTGCQVGDFTCGGGYGNHVWINHGNGYATLYGHLSTVSVTNGIVITDRLAQTLGIMGSTGRSTGTHLHFGLYYDQNKDGQWSESEAVDPYGLQGVGYLWIHPLSAQQQIDSSGGSASTPSGNLAITVPAGAVVSPITLELWDTPPVAGASATLRSTGNSFWMRVLEWLTGGGSPSPMTNISPNSFDVPVTVAVHYDPSSMPHLDTSQLTINQWDDVGLTWVALPTTLDTVNQLASAQTSQPGHFDLQAPLVCPADILEPNDNYDGSSVAQTDGTLVSNLFDIAQDEDWFRFDAIADTQYAIQTKNLAAGVDTALEIYDTDGVTLLASNDNGGGGNASSLTWQAPQDGLYFARVVQASGSSFGCSSTYNFAVTVVDTTVPTVNTFTVTSPSNSLNIPITVFTASDAVGVTGYLITTSATAPAAGAVGWTDTAPTTYTVVSDGSYTLYPWAKDAVDNVSTVFTSPRVVVVDTTTPTVSSITRVNPNPTNLSSVEFTVIFSEFVTGVDASDFSLSVTSDITGASIISANGSGTTYIVTVNTGTFNNVSSDLININFATLSELDSLPGIGPTTAQKIIDYRTLNGPFFRIEDIMNVSGIGPATFDKIKGLITVGGQFLRLNVVDDDTIVDNSNNKLGGSGLGNGNFTGGQYYTISKLAIFTDVPLDYWANTFIERLYHAGITGGCSIAPLMYCPETNVNRAQMAVFLLRGEHGSAYVPPAVGSGTSFTDVPSTHWAAAWIKQLAFEGITSGCGPNLYCPETSVTRDQMAVFLLRAEHGTSYTPPPATGVFTDVPTTHWAAPWIEQLAAESITGGCGSGNYCPETPVTRAQMAVFLVRTFSLP